jgi:hypothetical protein
MCPAVANIGAIGLHYILFARIECVLSSTPSLQRDEAAAMPRRELMMRKHARRMQGPGVGPA